ncbi:hypothetical protein DFS34DRAFT_645631 [Phlyctochytrium arcticum]|nr:hypothetical protein DFS34DRAFT_645631 [Phlyctochytrium arcticum]
MEVTDNGPTPSASSSASPAAEFIPMQSVSAAAPSGLPAPLIKKKRGRKGKKAAKPPMTQQQLAMARAETVANHYHSAKTVKSYTSRANCAKKYLATLPEYEGCLEEGNLDQRTADFCMVYLAYEMEEKQLSKSSAVTIRAALKDWFL